MVAAAATANAASANGAGSDAERDADAMGRIGEGEELEETNPLAIVPDSHPIATPARSRASWLEVVTAGSPPPLAHVEAGQPCEIGGGGGQGHAVVDREGGQDQQPLQAGGSSHQRLRDRAGGEGIRITQEDRGNQPLLNLSSLFLTYEDFSTQ